MALFSSAVAEGSDGYKVSDVCSLELVGRADSFYSGPSTVGFLK